MSKRMFFSATVQPNGMLQSEVPGAAGAGIGDRVITLVSSMMADQMKSKLQDALSELHRRTGIVFEKRRVAAGFDEEKNIHFFSIGQEGGMYYTTIPVQSSSKKAALATGVTLLAQQYRESDPMRAVWLSSLADSVEKQPEEETFRALVPVQPAIPSSALASRQSSGPGI